MSDWPYHIAHSLMDKDRTRDEWKLVSLSEHRTFRGYSLSISASCIAGMTEKAFLDRPCLNFRGKIEMCKDDAASVGHGHKISNS